SAKALFAGGGSSEDMPTTELSEEDLADGVDIMTLLVRTGLCSSKSDARRNVQQGGVTANDEKIADIGKTFSSEELRSGVVLRRGKKNYNKVILK
ncbi:MAG: tyrosine--tRNA ligase, partial [Oscillospiraceae bacterium]|nr:tyrosine--tRNA ligase [Oscillospiraceae bacterium]